MERLGLNGAVTTFSAKMSLAWRLFEEAGRLVSLFFVANLLAWDLAK